MAAPQLKHVLQGDKELQKQLIALANRYGSESLHSPLATAVVDALEPVEQQIKNTTPVRTGELKQRVYREGFVGKTYRIIAATGYKFSGRKDNQLFVAANVLEGGGKFHRALHTVKNAFESNREVVLRRFRERFNKDFERQFKK